MMIRFYICLLLLGQFLLAYSQELPPTQKFTPQMYEAGNQNWSISQAEDKTIYVANNSGLLEYNGAKWQLYETPNKTILRSVKVINQKIYTGSYMDFGFWVRDNFGMLNYTSLSEKYKLNLIEDEEIWKIEQLEGKVLFQSLDRIFVYDLTAESFDIIDPGSKIIKMYLVNNAVYYQKMNGSVYGYYQGSEKLLLKSEQIASNEIVNIFSEDNGDLLIETRENGFYLHNDGNLFKWEVPANDLLQNTSVYNSIRLNDGSFLLGTISKGVAQMNQYGEVILQMDQLDGLNNNTVLSLFEDLDGNIWLGLDNGINVLNFNAPYYFYKDIEGVLGTIYASISHNGYRYLGTNQGLFYSDESSSTNFELISSTKGQVWNLQIFDGTLFCGHDKGTFIVEGNQAQQISKEKGTWKIARIENTNLLLQGNYNGLYVLENKNGLWSLRNKIEGFDMSARYFEFIGTNEVLVSHEYKGVYRLQLDKAYRSINDYQKLTIEKGKNSSITSFNGSIFYANEDGIFKYDHSNRSFKKDSLLSSSFTDSDYTSGKLINDVKGNRLWFFTKNELIYVEPESLSGQYKLNRIPLPDQARKNKRGYENIRFIENDKYMLGGTEGYLVLNLDKINEKDQIISINAVQLNPLHGQTDYLDLNNESSELKNNQNSIQVSYSLANFNSYLPTEYRYRLKGIYEEWSDWSQSSSALFENLPHGNFNFEVEAKVGNKKSSNIASFMFSINKPWYLTPFAIIVYILLVLIIMSGIQLITRSYYKNQKERALAAKERELEYKELENQKQQVEFRNKSLHQDIENKNRELGISTMNLIKKNEFLSAIKNELKDISEVRDVKKVIRTIDKNINNKDDWEFFEKAFNNADKDFLKKVKNMHPDLTPNDLKLCAYLRLNLASKEIAPLLNISPKSVEVKRYRLRKKINLPHEESLTNYMLDI